MSDLIKLLPDAVANQIAAGEVIQRPASVVKELLENAVDAGATRIDLVIRESGKSLIQVTDNGIGMSETDARMCFERHATSKITKAEDLFSIRTMGFRGEALASIAAVAQVELRTRRANDEHGTLVKIEGSSVTAHEICVCPPGTTFYVRNLFFNVPARRNFLKSTPVELRHVMDEFQKVALIHPHILFTFSHNDKEIFHLVPGSFKQRIVGLFGSSFDERLLSVSQEAAKIQIEGFIIKPEFSRKTRGDQFFFVNNRFIRHAYLHHAVENAFSDLLPKDTFPGYIIHIKIDPAEIDVNIHPTKTEVNFLDTKLVYAIIHAAVRKTLGMHQLSPRLDFDQTRDHGIDFDDIVRPGRTITPPSITINHDYNPFHHARQSNGFSSKLKPNEKWRLFYEEFQPSDIQQTKRESTETIQQHPLFLQVHGTYVISIVKSGIMIVDQHLAHWRILFERFYEALQNGKGASQQLLFPQTIQLNAQDALLLEQLADYLRLIGFDINKAGERTFIISGLPQGFENQYIENLIEKVLEDVRNHVIEASTDFISILLASVTKKMAWPHGKTLSISEMSSLIDLLFACRTPERAPDQSKIFTLLTFEQLTQFFK